MPSASRSSKQTKKRQVEPKKEPRVHRERSLRACTRCRPRKQKCDNALPHCSNCVKGGVDCEAVPINIVSRDNLLQIYERLQESTRLKVALQNELRLARLVVPDTLALFSAVIAKQVMNTGHYMENNPQSGPASERVPTLSGQPSKNTKMQSPQADNSAVISVDTTSEAKLIAESTVPTSIAETDIWKTLELLGVCFPAAAAAICIAFEQPDQNPGSESSCKLIDVASIPIRDLQILLGGSATFASQGHFQELAVDELIRRIMTASETTRVAAALLWALLAFVQHRGEELIRMDTVLTCFMQAWQASPTSGSVPLTINSTIATAFYRAYDWIHLQTAIMTGKLHIQATSMSSFEAIQVIASKTDLPTFLASFHLEQKRLEYVALHLFTSPVGELSDTKHEESVWNLLSSIKDLSDVHIQSFDACSAASTSSSVNAQRVLMRHKLGTQLYGMFPRMLFMHCPNDRRHWRWLNNALPLAMTALSCHHAAWFQSGWLGDHAFDALMFTDLLAAFQWTLQQHRVQNEVREDMNENVQMAIELGERFASKWPQCFTMIHTAIRQLCTFQSTISSGLSTPWPATSSVATSHAASSPVLRTPQPCEVSHPTVDTYPQPLPEQWQTEARADWAASNEEAFNSIGTDFGMPLFSSTLDRSKDALQTTNAFAAVQPIDAAQPKPTLLYLEDQAHDRTLTPLKM